MQFPLPGKLNTSEVSGKSIDLLYFNNMIAKYSVKTRSGLDLKWLIALKRKASAVVNFAII